MGDPARGEYHALLWSGSADSAVELLPANSGYAFSDANAIVGDVKVGDGAAATVRALLWSGPQNQLTDLTPAWATDAALYAHQRQPARGFVIVTGAVHAAVWLGSSAGDATDLNDYLPPEFANSHAFGIDANGDVVGVAISSTGAHAFLWTPIPEPAALSLAMVTAALGIRRRRSR